MSSSTLPALPLLSRARPQVKKLVLPFALEQDPKRTDQYRTTEKRRRLNIYWDYSIDTLNALDVPDTNNGDWVAAEHSQTTFTRLFPVIKKSKFDTDYKNYKLLFAFQGTENGFPYIKGALQHRKTGKIVMLTATTKPRAEIKEGKPKPSRAEGWHVYGVHMTAPPCFWRAFKAC